MSHPGVGPVAGLAFALTVGAVERFRRSKQVVSYLGLNPREKLVGLRRQACPVYPQPVEGSLARGLPKG